MAVFFSVLKIIGIVVLIILLAVILILAVLLFVPVRYEAEGKIDEKTYSIRVTWLLRLFRFMLTYDGETADYYIALFGHRTHLLDRDRKSGKKKKHRKKKKKHGKKKEKKETPETSCEYEGSADIPAGGRGETSREAGEEKKHPAFLPPFLSKAADRLKEIIRLLKTGKEILEKYQPVSMILPKLKKLLYRIRPRRLAGDLVFGFADPANTGMLIGLISNLYFLYRYENFHICGDFETNKAYISGTFSAEGRIRLFAVLIFAIALIKEKEFRQLLKALKK